MNAKIDEIIAQLKELSLIEATKLVKQIEEVFDVDASAISGGVVMAGGNASSSSEAAEEQTEFSLVLEEVPADKKIAILKLVRSLTGLGLKEAKELVESAPKVIKEGVSKDDVEVAKKDFEDVGAKVTIK
jgi:large subunit ribosomal protein L7/L12